MTIDTDDEAGGDNGGIQRSNPPSPEGQPNTQRPRTNDNDDAANNDHDGIFTVCRPIDNSLTRMLTRLNFTSLQELLDRDSNDQQNYHCIDLQILRVIAPANLPGTNGAFTYSNRSRNRNTGNQINYTRLFLVRVHSTNEGNRLCYLMETRTQNTTLWNRNVELRDNGVLTMGTVIRVLAPRPIDSLMVGDIPLLNTNFPVIIMNAPTSYLRVSIDYQVQGNNAFAFALNNINVFIKNTSPKSTSCSGLTCDRQRLEDWNGTERGCGCYAMHHRRSSIAIQHDVELFGADNLNLTMENFSSNKFSKLYLSSNLSPNILLQQMQYTEEFFDLLDRIDRVMDFIRDNGGFTIIGWYKRGLINDRSLVSNANTNNNHGNNGADTVQVDNGDVHFHIIEILPTDHSMLNHLSVLGAQLNNHKFDVNQMH